MRNAGGKANWQLHGRAGMALLDVDMAALLRLDHLAGVFRGQYRPTGPAAGR